MGAMLVVQVIKVACCVAIFIYGFSIGVRLAEKRVKCVDSARPEQLQWQGRQDQIGSERVPAPVNRAVLCKENTSKIREKTTLAQKPAMSSFSKNVQQTCESFLASFDSLVEQDHTHLHLWKGDVAKSVFHNLHNPASAAKEQFIVTSNAEWKSEPDSKRPSTNEIKIERDRAGFAIKSKEDGNGLTGEVDNWDGEDPGLNDFWDPHLSANCKELYLTRTGSRENQPNKCVAIARVPAGSESPVQHSHRVGYTARLTNQYQADYSRRGTLKEERDLLPPLLRSLDDLIDTFKQKVGPPIDQKTGEIRTIIVMVANEGVYDLLLNFLCSIDNIGTVNKRDIVVFVGTKSFAAVVENLGVHALHSTALGSMPEHAAGGYLDKTFSRMMWFKATSVYLAAKCGYHVLFQDVDLVWLTNPIPYMLSIESDVSFMDDGARSPRYTPFFVNSGFYLVKANPRTAYFEEKLLKSGPSEIGFTHSHQSVLIRHVSESSHHAGLKVYVLDRELFPSGQAYHENKPFIKKIINHDFRPYVFHMCWTSNRVDKVKYFKEMGLWYLPYDGNEKTVRKMCTDPKHAQAYVKNEQRSLVSQCCQTEKYW
jgi:hypothetical protein